MILKFKMFESIEDEYYSIINNTHPLNWDMDKYEYISKSKQEKISRLSYNFYLYNTLDYSTRHKLKNSFSSGFSERVMENGMIYIPSDNTYQIISIKKDNDEWYYLRSVTHKFVGFDGLKETINTSYKCDQWDGLIKCIKEKILNK